MTANEANAILEAIAIKERNSWEQSRWISYIQAITQGAKLKTPLDLIQFSWELSEADSALVPERTPEQIKESLLELKNSLKK